MGSALHVFGRRGASKQSFLDCFLSLDKSSECRGKQNSSRWSPCSDSENPSGELQDEGARYLVEPPVSPL